jgi:hypothetical protein
MGSSRTKLRQVAESWQPARVSPRRRPRRGGAWRVGLAVGLLRAERCRLERKIVDDHFDRTLSLALDQITAAIETLEAMEDVDT